MRKTLVGFARCTTGAGTVVADRAYNATVARVADGDYNVTVGKGGANADNCLIEIETELAAGSVVGSNSMASQTSDTVKRLQFRNATNGALAAPVGFAVSIYRYSPAITGT